jgi:hypothetical protein
MRSAGAAGSTPSSRRGRRYCGADWRALCDLLGEVKRVLRDRRLCRRAEPADPLDHPARHRPNLFLRTKERNPNAHGRPRSHLRSPHCRRPVPRNRGRRAHATLPAGDRPRRCTDVRWLGRWSTSRISWCRHWKRSISSECTVFPGISREQCNRSGSRGTPSCHSASSAGIMARLSEL